MLPAASQMTICFAHVAYQMQARFALRQAGIESFEVRDRAGLEAGIARADVLVVSGLWRNELAAMAPKLRFIQSIGAGTDQFDREVLRGRGIRLASAAGVNARAVSEHAMSLILALARRLPEARDNQAKKHWRGMIGDLAQREDELQGKTVVSYCTGGIRCEKAALVMQDAGLTHVHQLEGGVLRYFEDTGHAPGWRGDCVVFDDRGALRNDLSPTGARAAS